MAMPGFAVAKTAGDLPTSCAARQATPVRIGIGPLSSMSVSERCRAHAFAAESPPLLARTASAAMAIFERNLHITKRPQARLCAIKNSPRDRKGRYRGKQVLQGAHSCVHRTPAIPRVWPNELLPADCLTLARAAVSRIRMSHSWVRRGAPLARGLGRLALSHPWLASNHG
jgi:hypothetical protein